MRESNEILTRKNFKVNISALFNVLNLWVGLVHGYEI